MNLASQECVREQCSSRMAGYVNFRYDSNITAGRIRYYFLYFLLDVIAAIFFAIIHVRPKTADFFLNHCLLK